MTAAIAELSPLEKDLSKALLEGLAAGKDYQELVADGAAMQRLLKNADFQRYEKLMADSTLLLLRRITEADEKDLPGLRGALRQHLSNMRLAHKVLEIAEKCVERKRGDDNSEGE